MIYPLQTEQHCLLIGHSIILQPMIDYGDEPNNFGIMHGDEYDKSII